MPRQLHAGRAPPGISGRACRKTRRSRRHRDPAGLRLRADDEQKLCADRAHAHSHRLAHRAHHQRHAARRRHDCRACRCQRASSRRVLRRRAAGDLRAYSPPRELRPHARARSPAQEPDGARDALRGELHGHAREYRRGRRSGRAVGRDGLRPDPLHRHGRAPSHDGGRKHFSTTRALPCEPRCGGRGADRAPPAHLDGKSLLPREPAAPEAPGQDRRRGRHLRKSGDSPGRRAARRLSARRRPRHDLAVPLAVDLRPHPADRRRRALLQVHRRQPARARVQGHLVRRRGEGRSGARDRGDNDLPGLRALSVLPARRIDRAGRPRLLRGAADFRAAAVRRECRRPQHHQLARPLRRPAARSRVGRRAARRPRKPAGHVHCRYAHGRPPRRPRLDRGEGAFRAAAVPRKHRRL